MSQSSNRRQALSNAIDTNETSSASASVAGTNQKTTIDLIDWARHSIVSLLERHEPIVSLLQWHEKNKLYYVVDMNQKWVCFNDIRQEEIGLKRLMSLKHSMSRRNRLETPDEMSLKRSNRTVTKRTRKKEADWSNEIIAWLKRKRVMLRACSAFYWNTCSLSEPKALSSLALSFSLYI